MELSAHRGKGAEVFKVSPFKRLARAHGLGVGGDALIAIALADSLFFSIDPNDARWKVALYLILTIAPFGLVAPFLGPAMDRMKGGHRIMIILVGAIRALLALAMVRYVDTFLLFPLAFSLLVFGKAHHVAKSALVPTLVETDEALVKANSQLSIVSALSGGLAGIPGVILLRFGGGAPSILILATVLFALGALFGFKIPATVVADSGPDEDEKAELRSTGIILAASTMAYVRGVVGFLTMLIAFELRGGVDPGPTGVGVEIAHRVREAMGLQRLDLATGGSPAWHFGVVLLAIGVGGISGSIAAPRLRSHVSEERILASVLGLVSIFGFLGALSGGLLGAMMVGLVVALAASAGKQSFDAIVQRDAPDANLGRSFGRFESRFQLAWVLGAIIPVVVPIPARLGFLILAIPAGFAGVSYWFGRNPGIQAEAARSARERARERANTVRMKAQNRRFRTRRAKADDLQPGHAETAEVPVVGKTAVDKTAVDKSAVDKTAVDKTAVDKYSLDTIELGWADDDITKPLPKPPEPPSRPSS